MHSLNIATVFATIGGVFSANSNYLSWNLAAEIVKNTEYKGKNFIASPYSLEQALGMLVLGADGTTKQQILHAFNYDSLDAAIEQLNQPLKNMHSAEMRSVNRIYINDNFQVKDAYASQVSEKLNAKIESVTMNGDTVQKINTYVANYTNDKIQNMLQDLSDDTQILLLNAIYMKAKWAERFYDDNTANNATFFTSAELTNTGNVYMMKQGHNYYNYAENDDAQFVELPYKHDELIMRIILPKEKFNLQSVMDKIRQNSAEYLSGLSYSMAQVTKLHLPKWKSESSFDLTSLLPNVGISAAFTSDAEFSQISDTPLKVDKSIQKAFISVDENGTEAAASTTIEMVLTSAVYYQNAVQVEFIADHPFAYTIEEPQSGRVLFIGQVFEPCLSS